MYSSSPLVEVFSGFVNAKAFKQQKAAYNNDYCNAIIVIWHLDRMKFKAQKMPKISTKSPGKPKATREYLGLSTSNRMYFVNTAAVSSMDSLCLMTIRLTDETGTRDSTRGKTASSE